MRKKKLYVVGYDGDNQCIYGKDRRDSITNVNHAMWCDPMSGYDVKRKIKDLDNDYKPVIYLLVPIKEEDLK